jgi:hypothetical protein
MKLRNLVTIAASVLVLGAIPSFAEDFSRITVNVPFAFRAGSVTLPAGQYVVVEAGPSGLLMIEGRKGSAMLIAGPSQDTVAGASEITFRRTGQEAVLTEIRLNGAMRSLPLH